MKALLLGVCLLCSCVVSQVSYKGGVGEELRPGENRLSAKSGIETELESGVKLDATYRTRTTDLKSDKVEHGFFFDVSVPLWKKRK